MVCKGWMGWGVKMPQKLSMWFMDIPIRYRQIFRGEKWSEQKNVCKIAWCPEKSKDKHFGLVYYYVYRLTKTKPYIKKFWEKMHIICEYFTKNLNGLVHCVRLLLLFYSLIITIRLSVFYSHEWETSVNCIK